MPFWRTLIGSMVAFFLAISMLGSAQAAPTYGSITTQVVLGFGNINSGFWFDSADGVLVALRATNRQTGNVIDGADGTYNVAPGICTGGLCGFSPNKSNGNFDYVANPGVNQGIAFRLGVDHDPSAAVNYTYVDPGSYWQDNAIVGPSFQGSRNMKAVTTPGGAFDANQIGLYDFVLEAWRGNLLVTSTHMQIQVGELVVTTNDVPEPGSFALLAIGLTGMMATRRRRTVN